MYHQDYRTNKSIKTVERKRDFAITAHFPWVLLLTIYLMFCMPFCAAVLLSEKSFFSQVYLMERILLLSRHPVSLKCLDQTQKVVVCMTELLLNRLIALMV